MKHVGMKWYEMTRMSLIDVCTW